MTTWLPDITQAAGPKYLAIANAIGSAVADGSLPSGTKLPPQRNLAYDIGVTLGTVTRAYREAERRGFVGGEVGRGTYVLGKNQNNADGLIIAGDTLPGVIDFTHATPTTGIAGEALSATLKEIAEEPNIDALANYQMHTGIAQHLEAGAHWLTGNGLNSSVENVTLTNGVQHGLLATLMALMSPGDTMLLEELTYPGALHLARKFGHRVDTIRMDEDGLIPEALDEACRRTSARVLYTMPTLHNPTVATMPEERRIKIAEIAKRHSLLIVEDDIWARLSDIHLPHFANLLPEQTIYLSSLSKCMSGGLRIGYIHTPPRLTERLRTAVRLTCWMPAPLMAEVARRWIYSDVGDELAQRQREEVSRRCSVVCQHLSPYDFRHRTNSHHIWLKLPDHWQAQEFRSRAEDRGVRVLGAQSFVLNRHTAPNAVRICAGRPETMDQVEKGAAILVDLLESDPDANEPFI